MIKPGLVSITFRRLSFEEIIVCVMKVGLCAIEWGGDVHVPHGDLTKACRVYEATSQAGLEVAAYGSYYCVGHSPSEGLEFEMVLDTAAALKAPTIRVWAGNIPSAKADKTYYTHVVSQTQKIAEQAAAAGINIAFEFHRNTLADTSDGALNLMRDISCANVNMYWQPIIGAGFQENMDCLQALLPHLENIHVTQFTPELKCYSIAETKEEWAAYLSCLLASPIDHCALIEFSEDDSIENFFNDSAILKSLLQ